MNPLKIIKKIVDDCNMGAIGSVVAKSILISLTLLAAIGIIRAALGILLKML